MSKHTLWKSLSCDLTSDEISTYSTELANITTEQSEIEAEKKEIMSNFTARLNKCIADGRVLARKITTRKEDRQVECDLVFDYAKGVVFTVRTDTDVTIGQRKLTDDERQEWLDFEGEQDKQQAIEEKAEDTAEVPQGEPAKEISICDNTNCYEHEPTEPNHCGYCENVWECENSFQEGTEETAENNCNPTVEDETEHARRDSICKEWIECEHKNICFTPQNEEEAICFKDEPHRIPGPEDKAIVYARSEKVIELPVEAFASKGALEKARTGMAGVPDDGKVSKVFTHDDNLFLLTGSLSSGREGNIEFFGYQMIPVENWNTNIIQPVTVSARVAEPNRSGLSHTGCLVTHNKKSYVLYRPTKFIHEQIAGETAPTLMELCSQCHTSNGGCQDCCKTCETQCNASQICRWPLDTAA
jgi:hypothetical protein